MLVKGMRAPIAGRVCMDQTLIDVGHIPDVKQGDEVVIMGSQKDETISADEIASLTGTFNSMLEYMREHQIIEALGNELKTVFQLETLAPIVRERLRVYRENTMPLIDYYKERGLLVRIDASKEIDEITDEVLKAIGEG
jgi:hypothetical protein